MPGIQLHASVADSILSNRFIRPAPTWWTGVAALVGAVTIGLAAAMLPFWVAATTTAAVIGAWTAGVLAAFDRGLWLPLAQPLAGTALALFAGTAYRYFVEDAEKRKVSRLFGRYVSRDVYKQLMSNPDLAELGGARREMSVLFSDLRGFTTITEKGNPEELVRQLNEYFTRMVDIVFRNGGTVDKFVGDMVMALFGAPVDDVDHADAAVSAAVEMVRELGELNRQWAAEGRVQLDIGVGVNSGDMIAGNIGSSAIMSYTVIGDNVNLGSRLESLNKEYRTRIIISEATRSRLTKPYELRAARRRRGQGQDAAGRDLRGRSCRHRWLPSRPCASAARRRRGKNHMKTRALTLGALPRRRLLIGASPADAQFGGLSGVTKAQERSRSCPTPASPTPKSARSASKSATRSSRPSASIRTRTSRNT